MADKVTIQRAFNAHFFELMDDIISIYPNNVEITSAKDSFALIKRANPTAIIKAWYKHIYKPYSDIIDGGDIRFFFIKDYSDDLDHLKNAKKIMDIIDKIRGPVSEMNDHNQASTLKYLQNLCKLSDVYNDITNSN